MPRGPRLDAPGILHHVWIRGIERRRIFKNEYDRRDFVKRLEKCCENGKALVYAWCLMPNHVHLAIRTGSRPLSRTMSSLLTGYVVAFNNRYRRSGHLFQNRYKSTVVDDEQYFLSLVRYIHLNPIRARIVGSIMELRAYPWAGHSVLMGGGRASFQDTEDVLARFANKVGSARKGLVRFMGDEAARDEHKIFRGAGGGLVRSKGGLEEILREGEGQKEAYDERILGSGDFVTRVLEEALAEQPPVGLSKERQMEQYDDLVERVCSALEIERAELMSGSRRRIVTKARQVIAYISIRRIGLSGIEVARTMRVSNAAINKATTKGKVTLEELGWRVEELIAK